jgi:hypothetical protein
MITRKQLDSSAHLITDSAYTWAVENWDYMLKPMRILGSSVKVEKGNDKLETYIVYLQPANKVSKVTLCAGAYASGCEAPCLISSGQLGMTVGQKAATKRTILLVCNPTGFYDALRKDIIRAEKRAKKTDIPALFRLNGTSDIDFSEFIASMPESNFYDYTKILSRVRKNTLENYDLTFSASMFSLASKATLAKAVKAGYRIAVPFNTKGLASDNVSIPTSLVSFDDTDLRPLDTPNAIGYLKRKGSSKADRSMETEKSFFVTAQNLPEFISIVNL